MNESDTVRRVGGPLALAMMTLGLVTWPIGFHLGAYGQILYDDIFRLVVSSSILAVIISIKPAYPTRWNVLVVLALALPLAWFIGASVIVGSTSEAMDRPVFVVALVFALVVSVPITLRLLVDLFVPEVVAHGNRRLTGWMLTLVAVIGLVGFTFGLNNDRYMLCSDFAIAGAAEPDNCQR